MRIKVRYLGAFADVAQSKEATYDLAAPSLDLLIDHLVKLNGEKFRTVMVDGATGEWRGGVTLLVNGQRVSRRHALSPDDEVTLLTPLAGG